MRSTTLGLRMAAERRGRTRRKVFMPQGFVVVVLGPLPVVVVLVVWYDKATRCWDHQYGLLVRRQQ